MSIDQRLQASFKCNKLLAQHPSHPVLIIHNIMTMRMRTRMRKRKMMILTLVVELIAVFPQLVALLLGFS